MRVLNIYKYIKKPQFLLQTVQEGNNDLYDCTVDANVTPNVN